MRRVISQVDAAAHLAKEDTEEPSLKAPEDAVAVALQGISKRLEGIITSNEHATEGVRALAQSTMECVQIISGISERIAATLNRPQPTPINAPEAKRPLRWKFSIVRAGDGRIKGIEATAEEL